MNFQHSVLAVQSSTVRGLPIAALNCYSEPRTGPASFNSGNRRTWGPRDLASSNYVACAGARFDPRAGIEATDGMFCRNVARALRDVEDGTSYTLLLGERARTLSDATWAGVAPDGLLPGVGHCTQPSWPASSCGDAFGMVLGFTDRPVGDPGPPLDVDSARSGHANFLSNHGDALFANVDGSVRRVRPTISPSVFHAMATRAGAETNHGQDPY